MWKKNFGIIANSMHPQSKLSEKEQIPELIPVSIAAAFASPVAKL